MSKLLSFISTSMRNGVLKSHNTIRNEFKFTNMRSRINRTEHSHSTNINKTAKRSLTLIVTTISATAAATLLLHQKSHLAAEVDGAATAIKSANEVADSTQVSSTLPSEACKELSSLLGSRFTMDKDDCSAHANDSSSYHSGPLPAAVAYPVSTEEVSKIAQIASKYKFILVPYGSGTSLEGHTSAPNNGSLTVDMSHMQRILKIHAEDMQVTVEPGVSYHHLNDELKSTGLYFPVDPGPGASIGGMVGTSCSGTNAVRYGTMKFNVVNVTVVLADGTIIKTAQRARKSSAGYDLTRLFIGSEGTLGIITEVTLKLHNIPEQTAVAVCQFDSIKSAAAAASAIERNGARLGCIELLDDVCIRIVNAYSNFTYAEKPSIFFKFHGSKGSVADDISKVESIVKSHMALGPLVYTSDPIECNRIWDARKQALWATMAYRPNGRVWTTDVCVPISRLAECIDETKRDIQQHPQFIAPIVGHVGDGNFHVLMCIDPSDPSEMKIASTINSRMIERAISMEGTCTGEHGVGIGKREYLERELGIESVELMRKLKRTIDPLNIMNPGKIFFS